jgi:hypothetical protein
LFAANLVFELLEQELMFFLVVVVGVYVGFFGGLYFGLIFAFGLCFMLLLVVVVECFPLLLRVTMAFFISCRLCLKIRYECNLF